MERDFSFSLDRDLYHPHMWYLYRHDDKGIKLVAVVYNEYDLALKWCEELNNNTKDIVGVIKG